MVLPTFSARVRGCFRGGVISSRVRVFGLVLGLLNQRLIRWQLLVRGIYMHERCRHECIRMQMYALVVDEMPMLMCSKYFMRNDTYAADGSLYRYVLRVNHHLWIKTCIWVLAVQLTQMVPNFYDKQIFHTQSYCQNFSSIGVIIILLKFQQVFSPTPCQNFYNLSAWFLKMKFYQWAILSMNCMYKNLQAKTPTFDRTSISHI